MAREWLDKSREARQDVSERMVKEWEKNRQKKLTGNSATKEGCGVSLYHSYKTFVEQWQQLRRQTLAEGGGEGAVDLKSSSMGLEAISSSIGDSRLAGMGAGGGNAATNDKPPGFNEWMEKGSVDDIGAGGAELGLEDAVKVLGVALARERVRVSQHRDDAEPD